MGRSRLEARIGCARRDDRATLRDLGWVPLEDMYANVYFVYGARGEQPPALIDIPAPTN